MLDAVGINRVQHFRLFAFSSALFMRRSGIPMWIPQSLQRRFLNKGMRNTPCVLPFPHRSQHKSEIPVKARFYRNVYFFATDAALGICHRFLQNLSKDSVAIRALLCYTYIVSNITAIYKKVHNLVFVFPQQIFRF